MVTDCDEFLIIKFVTKICVNGI